MPTEHGGWGFLFEPILLGLLVLPNGAGAGLGLAATLVFLARSPLRVAWLDVRRGKRYPRTGLALRVGLAFLALGAVAAVLALLASPDRGAAVVALLAAVPLGAAQVVLEERGAARSFAGEFLGALALAASAPAIVLLGGGSAAVAALAFAALAWRAGSSISLVRVRLRQVRGESPPLAGLAAWHAAGLVLPLAVAGQGLTVWPVLAAVLVLAARAAWGAWRRPVVRAALVGMQELGFGLLFAVACGLALAS
ncbi:MAG TPA: YwiC-like family protein [Deinococcales bacterium]|nr:YwiC-like family protein [Deinococcales bacterium]